MTKSERYTKCSEYFNKLADAINNYTVIGSINQDFSKYLIPNGTEQQLSYESKPMYSFRISDHWNWYANLNKCSKAWYIQCLTRDMPWAKKRLKEGYASKPINGVSVMFYGSDGLYHCVFGEVFDRTTKTWNWIETPIEEVLKMIPA